MLLAGIGALVQNGRGFNWMISQYDGAELLQTLLPYLIVKKEQACLAIEFVDKQGPHIGGQGWIVPQDVVDEKERYYVAMQELKN